MRVFGDSIRQFSCEFDFDSHESCSNQAVVCRDVSVLCAEAHAELPLPIVSASAITAPLLQLGFTSSTIQLVQEPVADSIAISRKSKSTLESQSQNHRQNRRMLSPKTLTVGGFDREFDFDSRLHSCASKPDSQSDSPYAVALVMIFGRELGVDLHEWSCSKCADV